MGANPWRKRACSSDGDKPPSGPLTRHTGPVPAGTASRSGRDPGASDNTPRQASAATDVPALLMYITSFRQNAFAVGAAIGTVLLLLVAVIIVPYLASQFKTEEAR